MNGLCKALGNFCGIENKNTKKKRIQLFRERLSYKRGKANATMSKIIMGNGGFTVALLNLKVFQRGGRKQLKQVYSW